MASDRAQILITAVDQTRSALAQVKANLEGLSVAANKVNGVLAGLGAALSLGASGFQTFLRVTLPNIRWGLLYGVLLCSARAMGEFGAVSVVSGHLRGLTNTMPLHVEILYNEYNFVAAFAVASLLALLALVTLVLKSIVEWRFDYKRGSAGH